MVQIEKECVYKGIKYIICFMYMGFRCGYVEVPLNIDADKIMCHGGITYEDFDVQGIKAKDGYKWIGFDCMHFLDATDIELSKKYFSTVLPDNFFEKFSLFNVSKEMKKKVWTLEMVENECFDIIHQVLSKMNK